MDESRRKALLVVFVVLVVMWMAFEQGVPKEATLIRDAPEVVSPVPVPPAKPEDGRALVNLCREMREVEIDGRLIGTHHVADAPECAATCRDNSGCSHSTFVPPNVCRILAASYGENAKPNRTSYDCVWMCAGAETGAAPALPSTCTMEKDVWYEGGPIGDFSVQIHDRAPDMSSACTSRVASPEACAASCASNARCASYNYRVSDSACHRFTQRTNRHDGGDGPGHYTVCNKNVYVHITRATMFERYPYVRMAAHLVLLFMAPAVALRYAGGFHTVMKQYDVIAEWVAGSGLHDALGCPLHDATLAVFAVVGGAVVFWGIGGLLQIPAFYPEVLSLSIDKTWRIQYDRFPKQMLTAEDRSIFWRRVLPVVVRNYFIGWACTFAMARFAIDQTKAFDIEQLERLDAPTLCLQILTFMMVEEVGFYMTHRCVHAVPSLYRNIHKQHHEWTAPIAWIAIYCHPIEHLVSNLLPMYLGVAGADRLAAVLHGHGFTEVSCLHFSTCHVMLGFGLLHTLAVHCGYFWNDDEGLHDCHHEKFDVNFGIIGLCDRLCGTFMEPRGGPEGKAVHAVHSGKDD